MITIDESTGKIGGKNERTRPNNKLLPAVALVDAMAGTQNNFTYGEENGIIQVGHSTPWRVKKMPAWHIRGTENPKGH